MSNQLTNMQNFYFFKFDLFTSNFVGNLLQFLTVEDFKQMRNIDRHFRDIVQNNFIFQEYVKILKICYLIKSEKYEESLNFVNKLKFQDLSESEFTMILNHIPKQINDNKILLKRFCLNKKFKITILLIKNKKIKKHFFSITNQIKQECVDFNKKDTLTCFNVLGVNLPKEELQNYVNNLNNKVPINSLCLFNQYEDEEICVNLNQNFKEIKITNIRELNISKNRLQPHHLKLISEFFVKQNYISSLTLNDNEINSEGAEIVAKLVDKTHLSKLSLVNNNIKSEGVYHLCEVLKGKKEIKFINLANNNIDEKGILCLFELLKMNKSIISLSIKRNIFNLNEEIINLIKSEQSQRVFNMDCLLEAKNIKEISDQLKMSRLCLILKFQGYNHNDVNEKTLSTLEPRDHSSKFQLNVNESNIKHISNYLSTNSGLDELYIFTDDIDAEQMKMLCFGLSKLKLKKIKLNFSNFHEHNAKFLFQALKMNNYIQNISLPYNKINDETVLYISEALKKNNSITSLNLSNNLIGNKGVHSLFSALHSNNGIKNLNLANNKISSESVEYICNYIEKKNIMTGLNLANNMFEDKDLQLLIRSLTISTAITDIDLSCCIQLESGTIELICLLIKSKPHLNRLCLRESEIKFEGIKMILSSIDFDKQTAFDFSYCCIDKEAIKMIKLYSEEGRIKLMKKEDSYYYFQNFASERPTLFI